ncbi:hypothetical protein SISSUDRAFT_1032853 [Sistotremastrum suecicum HHB10207 ss-3]|uniref:Uncharacterized protein n=1 Tax=Sistotremastrum suecicum HHB10207 ss-3 TaxID=1314776 RepID=A0A166E4S9_9AGAM|nr:hypothetical protein SISSUDRAFT_1032853 [Sistotremastrum suecicum HHB10207 ss-3]
MAEQVQAASQAVAMIPAMSAVAHESTLVEVIARLESIERQQDRLHEEFNELKALVQQTREGPERFEKRLDDQIKAFNLDQQRLPARLHNATASKGPNPIKAPPTASGKTPKNFPNTKGEFEHLTRERYETIMVEYGIPISGDITAKRDTLRSFLGIPA